MDDGDWRGCGGQALRAPDHLVTERLVLRRPRAADAEAIFTRYAKDPMVTKYIGWPRHTTIEMTREFLAFSDASWEQQASSWYLLETRAEGRLIGSTGLTFDTPDCAMTGYVLAQDSLEAANIRGERAGGFNLPIRFEKIANPVVVVVLR